ncbi:class I SAM-dependent RNA methyltransferase [candidate division KSB1 bacterium]|nr:class I SAM-dependent RNA methyltransferase [candidate division KSB1 bacterium]
MINNTELSRILVTCAKGIAPYLKNEISALGFPILEEKTLGIFTQGSFNDTIGLNMQLRTGLRVLYLLDEFSAYTPDELYDRLIQINWEDYIHKDGYISVTSSVSTDSIKDSRFANLKCKDAIVDRIQQKCGARPDSGPDRDKAVIFLYWKDDICAVFLDTTGEPLSKRGYRKIPMKAPMQETLAAAVILATGWDGNGPFINPMCGSGTLAIEAAFIALNKAPGLLRHNFGFMHFKQYDKEHYQSIRRDLRSKMKKTPDFDIWATDIDPGAVSAAQKNANTAGVEHLINFQVCDFTGTPVPEREGGIIVLNPEYGFRLNEEKGLAGVYKGIGDFFKTNCTNYKGYIFTGNLSLAKKVGLKTSRRLIFYNGSIECRLLEYELYTGTKKPYKTEKADP